MPEALVVLRPFFVIGYHPVNAHTHTERDCALCPIHYKSEKTHFRATYLSLYHIICHQFLHSIFHINTSAILSDTCYLDRWCFSRFAVWEKCKHLRYVAASGVCLTGAHLTSFSCLFVSVVTFVLYEMLSCMPLLWLVFVVFVAVPVIVSVVVRDDFVVFVLVVVVLMVITFQCCRCFYCLYNYCCCCFNWPLS